MISKSILILAVTISSFKSGSSNFEGKFDNVIRGSVGQILNSTIQDEIKPQYNSSNTGSIVTKSLNDTFGCIRKCWANDENRTTRVFVANSVQFLNLTVKTALNARTLNDTSFQSTIIEHVGLLFHDLCAASIETLKCFQRCPSSDLRDLAIQEYRTDIRMCEPERSYRGNFSGYYASIECLNKVVRPKPCASSCKPWRSMASNAAYELLEEDEAVVVQFNSDVNSTTSAVKDACKTYTCHRDCKQQQIIDQCDPDSFGLYVRLAKIEPSATLGALNILNAVDKFIPECIDWQ